MSEFDKAKIAQAVLQYQKEHGLLPVQQTESVDTQSSNPDLTDSNNSKEYNLPPPDIQIDEEKRLKECIDKCVLDLVARHQVNYKQVLQVRRVLKNLIRFLLRHRNKEQSLAQIRSAINPHDRYLVRMILDKLVQVYVVKEHTHTWNDTIGYSINYNENLVEFIAD